MTGTDRDGLRRLWLGGGDRAARQTARDVTEPIHLMAQRLAETIRPYSAATPNFDDVAGPARLLGGSSGGTTSEVMTSQNVWIRRT
jgi:hypothetical protein